MTSDNNDIKHYSAEDIARYWQGNMSTQEMHELEAAAMDDPFLADALEGYSTLNAQAVSADIKELRDRLADRSSDTKVVPLKKNKWWRVAAVLIFLGGAAALTYSLLMNTNSQQNSIVQATKKDAPTITEKEQAPSVQQTDTITTTPQNGNAFLKAYDSTSVNQINSKDAVAKSNKSAKEGEQFSFSIKEDHKYKKDVSGAVTSNASEVKSVPDLSAYRKKDSLSIPDWVTDDKQTADSITAVAAANDANRLRNNRALQENAARDQPQRRENFERDANSRLYFNNFSGRVVDQHNNAIPFATVKVNNNNQIAAANNEGVFQFRSMDSVVDLSVTSVGFNSRNVTLRGNLPVQDVMLEPQQKGKLSEVVVTKGAAPASKKKSVSPSELKVYVMDAQPVIGWDEYNEYLEKNQRIDSAYQSIKGEVVVSFNVGKNGQLSSFNIDKSLSKVQDAEAIRLIKDGPAWRVLKGRKTRARAIVKF